MTIRELHTRLGEIIAENEARPDWKERNNMTVAVELGVYGPKRKNGRRSYKSSLLPVLHARGAQINDFGCSIYAETQKGVQ